jgi:Na+-transporting NADH:ubiquinone oxidoreductase subunit F
VTTLLVGVLLVVGVSLVLAVFLLVAERRLANYGVCSIDINEGEEVVEVQGGSSLLDSLMQNNIFIPSACGGKGTCAYCKVRILEGGGPVAPTEEPLLSPEEIKDDMRISCQCKVRSDMRIEIPSEILSVKEYAGVVESMVDMTHDIKQLRIGLKEPPAIQFVPGQYIQLRAPAYGDNPEPVYRAYSLSSPPSDQKAIELLIRYVPEGICTTWVFEHLEEGSEVVFNGPYGDFRLSSTDREMIWIAGGSGMAPFWSLIRHMIEKGINRRTTYFFGAATEKDLFLVDELRRIQEEHDWFEFVPALSQPAEDTGWQGESGLITEVVDRHVGDGSDKEAYLCGSPGMINASITVLTDHGFTEERIFFDKFQ